MASDRGFWAVVCQYVGQLRLVVMTAFFLLILTLMAYLLGPTSRAASTVIVVDAILIALLGGAGIAMLWYCERRSSAPSALENRRDS